MEQKSNKYEQNIKMCVGRIKEVFPEAKIERLENLSIIESSDLLLEMPVEYKLENHTLYLDKEKVEKIGDPLNSIMYGLLEVITTDPKTNKHGVAFDGKMESVNKGITHMISNLLVLNSDENDTLFTSSVCANILTNIAGADTVIESYFNTDGEKMYNKLLSKFNNDPIFLDTMLSFIDIEATSLSEHKYPSLLSYIQGSLAQKYFESNDLTLEEAKDFHEAMFTEPKLAPQGQISRLMGCNECDKYVIEQIETMKEKNALSNKNNDELMTMFDNTESNKKEPTQVRR